MDDHGGLNNELAESEAWTSLLQQEAGVDDYLEVSCRCVDHMTGVNQEAAPASQETVRQGKHRLCPKPPPIPDIVHSIVWLPF